MCDRFDVADVALALHVVFAFPFGFSSMADYMLGP